MTFKSQELRPENRQPDPRAFFDKDADWKTKLHAPCMYVCGSWGLLKQLWKDYFCYNYYKYPTGKYRWMRGADMWQLIEHMSGLHHCGGSGLYQQV